MIGEKWRAWLKRIVRIGFMIAQRSRTKRGVGLKILGSIVRSIVRSIEH